MDDITTALIIVLCVNAMLFLGQAAILSINPEGALHYYDCKGSILGSYDANNCTSGNYTLANTDPASQLPAGAQSVSPDTGAWYIDLFTTAKNWLLDTVPGLSYLVGIVNAPANLLIALNLPAAFSFAVEAIWYILTIFLIAAWWLGK